ncbi:MAG: DUF3488 and transglutaminase-like domain-containing protein [Planctomycetota bacterium]|nr:DUF3488 and transglutaminase-like domain-containing protein [Planctomycetota bacterium]
MDLYRVMRISIYLMVASGALAISSVERDLFCLVLVTLGAILAAVTVDAGRARPARSWLAAALAVVLFVRYLLPALRHAQDDAAFQLSIRMAHFLVSIQVAMFFTAFRGTAFYSFCGASLFIVVLSGIVDHGPSLLLRLLVFLAATTWALFVHALWRGRIRFEDQNAGQARGRGAAAPAETPRNELSEKAMWQGLQMTAVLSVMCLLLGFGLFFTWPRLTGNLRDVFAAVFEKLQPQPNRPNEDGEGGSGPSGPRAGRDLSRLVSGGAATGLSNRVDLNELSPISTDNTPALSVEFDRPLREVVADESRLYLRAGAFHTYAHNRWAEAGAGERRRAEAGTEFVVFDPRDPNHLRPGPEAAGIAYQVKLEAQQRAVYPVLAGVSKVESLVVEEDEEGGVHAPGQNVLYPGETYRAESWQLPRYAALERVPSRTVNRRHRTWDMGEFAPQIQALAREAVAGARTDLEKALAIRRFLRDSGQYAYTLRLDQLDHRGNHIAQFLLGLPEQRRGHCGYFATAYAILARAAELPARLTYGYARTVDPVQLDQTQVTFKNSDAHAWAEVYFEGRGWIAFDATPGSDEASSPNGGTGPRSPPGEFDTERELAQRRAAEHGWLERGWDYFLQYNGESQEQLYGSMGTKMKDAFESLGDLFFSGSGAWGRTGTVLAWMVIVSLAAWALVALWRQQDQRRNPLRNLTPRAKAAVSFYNELLQVLSKKGFMRRAGQTPREFADAVLKRGGETYEPVVLVTRLFERVRYGGEDIGEDELLRLKDALGQLHRLLDEQERASKPLSSS